MATIEEIEAFRKQRLGDEIKRISDALKSAETGETARLPERVFANVFIPLFAGDEKLLYDINIYTWTNYAGGPYKSVDIIDQTGKVLFTVPPIFDRNIVNPLSTSRKSVASIVTVAKQYGAIHPNQGNAYLHNALGARDTFVKVPENMLKNLTAWNEIFKRYGRPEIRTLEDAGASKQIPKLSEDDFELL